MLQIVQMTWHSGHSLSQTLFTCMYIHQVYEVTPEEFMSRETPEIAATEPPFEFVTQVMKAFMAGVVKCCHLVWEEMIKGNVFEVGRGPTNIFDGSFMTNLS